MDYQFIENVGQGGFGIVDKVKDDKGHFYAKKRFSLHPVMSGQEVSALKRFLREAKYQKLLIHENIVPIFDLVEDGYDSYYIMPHADSTLVKDISSGYIHQDNFERVFVDMIAGLEFIHSRGITHRDLKPANVLRFGDKYAIGDFGLMALNETNITSITHTGVGKGSDFYTAPEITSDLRNATAQSDIYSLGCILHDFIGISPRVPCGEIRESGEYQHLLLATTRLDSRRRFKSVVSFRDVLSKVTKSKGIPKTAEGEFLVDKLSFDERLTEEVISQIANFLSSSVADHEKALVLNEIDLNHIKQIIESPSNINLISSALFDYVRNGSFDWNFADTLAQRVVKFIESGDTNIFAEGVMALIYMGVRHNRYYVEGIAYKYLCSRELSEELTSRLSMEFMVDGPALCKALNYLSDSISADLGNINPILHQTYKEICGQ